MYDDNLIIVLRMWKDNLHVLVNPCQEWQVCQS